MAVKISGFALLGYLLINMLLAVCQTIWTFSTTGQPLKERGHAFGGFYGESPRWLWCEKNKWWVDKNHIPTLKTNMESEKWWFPRSESPFPKGVPFSGSIYNGYHPPGENWKLTETNTEKSPARKIPEIQVPIDSVSSWGWLVGWPARWVHRLC